jgi:hypothetical protein
MYTFREMNLQALNSFLIQNGLQSRKDNTEDLTEIDTTKLKNYSTDFYVFYYPENYSLSFLSNSLIFYKDFEQIADVKILNLNSDNFGDFDKNTGNYFFSTNTDLSDTSNLPDFYNRFLVNINNDLIKKQQDIYVSYNTDTENKEQVFKRYKVNFYETINEYKVIGMYDPERGLDNIFLYTDNNILVVANLTMPSQDELNYFLMLITLINKQVTLR